MLISKGQVILIEGKQISMHQKSDLRRNLKESTWQSWLEALVSEISRFKCEATWNRENIGLHYGVG